MNDIYESLKALLDSTLKDNIGSSMVVGTDDFIYDMLEGGHEYNLARTELIARYGEGQVQEWEREWKRMRTNGTRR